MNKLIFIGASVLSFTAGSVSGYFYATKKLGEAFDRQVEEQVEKEMAVIFRNKDKAEFELQEAQERLRQLERIVNSTGPVVKDLEGSERVFYNNVLPAVRDFAEKHAPPGVVVDAMKKYQGVSLESQVEPTLDHPYQITDAMFTEGVAGYDQVQLTYYAGDGVLADDRDDIIEDPASIVGTEFHKLFGDLSGDANVVFIRNGVRDLDFEITRSEGKYGEEVAGFLPDMDPDPGGDNA